MKALFNYNSDLKHMVDSYNPFMLRNGAGNLECFKPRFECYREFMFRILNKGIGKWFDFGLLLYEWYGLKLDEAVSFVSDLPGTTYVIDGSFVINWTDHKEVKQIFEITCSKTQEFLGTTWSKQDFDMGFDALEPYMQWKEERQTY